MVTTVSTPLFRVSSFCMQHLDLGINRSKHRPLSSKFPILASPATSPSQEITPGKSAHTPRTCPCIIKTQVDLSTMRPSLPGGVTSRNPKDPAGAVVAPPREAQIENASNVSRHISVRKQDAPERSTMDTKHFALQGSTRVQRVLVMHLDRPTVSHHSSTFHHRCGWFAMREVLASGTFLPQLCPLA